jgi:transglutaminase/protease-like cytokinesis protein 3
MVQGKRIQVLAGASVVVFIGAALGACSPSSYPAPTAQTPDTPMRQSDAAEFRSVLPEVVVSASRLSSPRVAKETSSQRPTKRRGS